MTAFSSSHSGGKLALEAESFCGVAGDSSPTKDRKLRERSMPTICRGPVVIQASERLDHLPTTNEVQAGRVPSLLDFPCQGADMPSALRELLVAGTGCDFRIHPTLRIPAH